MGIVPPLPVGVVPADVTLWRLEEDVERFLLALIPRRDWKSRRYVKIVCVIEFNTTVIFDAQSSQTV